MNLRDARIVVVARTEGEETKLQYLLQVLKCGIEVGWEKIICVAGDYNYRDPLQLVSDIETEIEKSLVEAGGSDGSERR